MGRTGPIHGSNSLAKSRFRVEVALALWVALAGALAGCAATSQETPRPTPGPTTRDVFSREDAIAFGGGPGLEGRMDLLIMNSDGSNVACIVCDAALDPVTTAPSWSPDGKAIAYAATFTKASPMTQSAINVTLDEGRTVNLVLSPDEYEDPTWSPDGTEIAFTYRRRLGDDPDRPGGGLWADPQVCVVPFRSTGTPLPTAEIRCITSDGWSLQPHWSPGGSLIAYTHSRDVDSPADIYVISADGTAPTNLTNSPEDYEGEPKWSPDGKKIAFQKFDPELAQLNVWVMNADSSDPTNLTPGPEDGRHPAWSPDGSRIVFITTRTANPEQAWCEGGCLGNNELYLMDADGSNPTNITNDPGLYAEQPDWRPRPTESSAVPWIAAAGAGVIVIAGSAWVIRRQRRA